MLFNSIQFLIFFPIVVLIYFIIPARIKNFWLLMASYYFYMCWNAKYLLLIIFVTTITFISGLLLERIKENSICEKRGTYFAKSTVALSFVLTLGILLYFKYFNFGVNILSRLLSCIHIQLNFRQFDILLPVGISFYTFQALSYTMDVYRGEIHAEKNVFQYALFVSFFPQLVAGPIERSGNLLRQLATPARFDYEKFREGFLLMLWGFFLKIVIADRIAIFVNTVYGDFLAFPGWYLIVATMLFAIQIYCDFYGYSVIAMGVAHILGIQLMENFDAPYLAISVAEFWRRWHISLTLWFRDYLYVPLGGNRRGKLRKYINKFIVFLVSGLWHGASVSFIVWGGLNGLFQIIGESLQPVRDRLVILLKLNRESAGHKLISVLGTFFLVDFTWIFFRAESFKDSFAIIEQMFTVRNPWVLFDGTLFQCGLDNKNFDLLMICLCILLIADYCKWRGIIVRQFILKQDYWARWIFVVISIFSILLFGIWGTGYDKNSFVYFQF